jgi:hypothetical protein
MALALAIFAFSRNLYRQQVRITFTDDDREEERDSAWVAVLWKPQPPTVDDP